MRKQAMNELHYKGAALIKALFEKAGEHGDWIAEVASAIGLSPSFFTTVVSGYRSVDAMEPHFKRIAEFLAIPLDRVYAMAEIIDSRAVLLSRDLGELKIEAAYEAMCHDQELAFLVPSRMDWEMTPFPVRALIVLMYQHIAEKVSLEAPAEQDGNTAGPAEPFRSH